MIETTDLTITLKTPSSGQSNRDDMETKLKPLILIVEDEPDLRELVKYALEKRGYEVLEAGNGQEGIDLFVQYESKLCLIVSDVKMPIMDGIAFLEYVRAKSTVPFVFMTGYSEKVGQEQALKLGANEYINKPVRTSTLAEIVQRLATPLAKES